MLNIIALSLGGTGILLALIVFVLVYLNVIGDKINYSIVTADTSAKVNSVYLADTTEQSFSISLPTGLNTSNKGSNIKVIDSKGKFHTNPLSILTNGETINGSTSDVVLYKNYGYFSIEWDGLQWLRSQHTLQSVTTSSSSTMIVNHEYYVNTTDSSVSLTMPNTFVVGDMLRIIDAEGKFSTNNCIITIGDKSINGGTIDVTLSTNFDIVELFYTGSQWVMRNSANKTTATTLPKATFTLSANSASVVGVGTQKIDTWVTAPSTGIGFTSDTTNINGFIVGKSYLISYGVRLNTLNATNSSAVFSVFTASAVQIIGSSTHVHSVNNVSLDGNLTCVTFIYIPTTTDALYIENTSNTFGAHSDSTYLTIIQLNDQITI
jgi:hypothetical protein